MRKKWLRKLTKQQVSVPESKLQQLITIYPLKCTAQQRLMKCNPAESFFPEIQKVKVPMSRHLLRLQCFYIVSSISHHTQARILLSLFTYLFFPLTLNTSETVPALYLNLLPLLIEHLHLFPQVFLYIIMSRSTPWQICTQAYCCRKYPHEKP